MIDDVTTTQRIALLGEAARCPRDYHYALATTPLLWEVEIAPAPGEAPLPVVDAGQEFLEVGQCRACGEKLLRPINVRLAPRH